MKLLNHSNKNIVYALLCLSCYAISFNIAALSAAIPTMAADFQLSDLTVAKIVYYYMIPYGIAALIYAPLTRFISYRLALALVMFGFACSCFICSQANSFQWLLIGRIGMGITASGTIPLGLMIIGEMFTKKERGRRIGGFFSSAFLAALSGLLTLAYFDWRWLFDIPFILGIILSFNFMFLGTKLLGHKHKGSINYLKALKDRTIIKVFIYIFIMSFLYHALHKWFGVYLSQVYAYNKFQISLFFIVMTVGGLCGQLIGGVLTDKKGRLFSVYLGIFGLGFSTILLYINYYYIILGVIFLFISMFWTIGHNGISTVLTDFPEKHRPTIASLNSSIRFISGGLGFYLSSFFVAKSFSLTFLGIGLLILLLTILLNRLVPEHLT